MGIVSTSLSIPFNKTAKDGRFLLWEADKKDPPNDHSVFLRLFYKNEPDVIFSTTGTLTKSGRSKDTYKELIQFNGDSRVQFGKGNMLVTSIEKVGVYYGIDGEKVSPSFTFDSSRGQLVASLQVYGVAIVEYETHYDEYLLTLEGAPCSVTYDPINGMSVVGGYKGSTIFAFTVANNDSASITISPKECNLGDFAVVSEDSKAVEPSLVLEVDKNHPPRLSGFDNSNNTVKASCRIRVIPSIGASVSTSSGRLVPVKVSGDAQKENVLDAKTFSGSSSINLEYIPSSTPQITTQNQFLDTRGNPIVVSFLTAGDTVIEVDWITSNTYKNPRRRVVRENEVVAVTYGNKAIPVYGAIQARYAITYDLYELVFDPVDKLDPYKGWWDAHVVAVKGDFTSHILVSPPTLTFK